MNVPNALSALRIVLSIIAPFMVIYGGFWIQVLAGLVGLFAILSDWFDGWYARKYNLVTKLGKILDPVADKVYVIGTFSAFAYLGTFSFWWVVPIFLREIVVTIYRFIFLEKGTVVAAVQSGKVKTVMQMSTIGLAYLFFMVHRHYPEYFFDGLWWLLYAALAVTLYLTLQSGYDFFVNNWRHVKRVHS